MAAAVTPLLVSCGEQNPYATTITGEEVYIPTIARAKSDKEALKVEEANTLYWKDVKENQDVILQDLLYSITAKAYMAKRGILVDNTIHYGREVYSGWSFFEGDSDIHINYSNLSVDTTKKAISIDIEGSCNADLYLGGTRLKTGRWEPFYESAGLAINLSHFKFSFENIPYGVDYEEVYDETPGKETDYSNHWIIRPAIDLEEWLDNTKMTVEASGSIYATFSEKVFVYNNETAEITKKTKLPEKVVLGDEVVLLQGLLFIYGTSYHLSDIGVNTEK